MEVHPPDHAIHTWRDFFVHMATICLGLLIAIGLEQSVEWAHRRHERSVLEQELHEEASTNYERIGGLIEANAWTARRVHARVEAFKAAKHENGVVTIALPSSPHFHGKGNGDAPSQAVWQAATAAGEVRLLPNNVAQVFARVQFDADRARESAQSDNGLDGLNELLDRNNVELDPGTTVKLSEAVWSQALDLLEKQQWIYAHLVEAQADYCGAAHAAALGAPSVEAMDKYMTEEYQAAFRLLTSKD